MCAMTAGCGCGAVGRAQLAQGLPKPLGPGRRVRHRIDLGSTGRPGLEVGPGGRMCCGNKGQLGDVGVLTDVLALNLQGAQGGGGVVCSEKRNRNTSVPAPRAVPCPCPTVRAPTLGFSRPKALQNKQGVGAAVHQRRSPSRRALSGPAVPGAAGCTSSLPTADRTSRLQLLVHASPGVPGTRLLPPQPCST